MVFKTVATTSKTVVDITDSYSVVLSNEAVSIACDASGNAIAGQLGSSGVTLTTISVYKGSIKLSPVASASNPTIGQFKYILGTPVGCVAQRLNDEKFYLSTISADGGSVPITIYLEDTGTTINKAFTFAKSKTGATGATTYTWVKYADDINGAGMSDSPTGKRYLGLAYNKSTATESTTPTDYSWSPLYDNVKVGARNLVLGSKNGWSSTAYNVVQGILSQDWVVGETYTISLKGTINTGQSFGLWRDTGSVGIGNLIYDATTGIWKLTFVCPDTAQTAKNTFSVYNSPSGSATSATIEWIKIEKGNITTDWTPAPEDTIQVAQLYNGTSIDETNGFMSTRSDGLVRNIANATGGFVIQKRATTSDPWIDIFYVDTTGKLYVLNAEIAGVLNGVTGTFKGSIASTELLLSPDEFDYYGATRILMQTGFLGNGGSTYTRDGTIMLTTWNQAFEIISNDNGLLNGILLGANTKVTGNMEADGVVTGWAGIRLQDGYLEVGTYNTATYGVGRAMIFYDGNNRILRIGGRDNNYSEFDPGNTVPIDMSINGDTVHHEGNLMIATGNVSITPTAANTPTKATISFGKTFPGTPRVYATPSTTVPGTGVTGVGVASPTTTGCDIWVTRTNTTTTSVNWIAVWENVI